MSEEESGKRALAAAIRKSRRSLPYQALAALVFLPAIWGLHELIGFPAWIAWLGSLLAVMGVVGDAFNILYSLRALRRIGRG